MTEQSNKVPGFALHLDKGEIVYPKDMTVETTWDDSPFEYYVIAGNLTTTQEKGDDFAIGFIEGSTPIQRVDRTEPLQDYPQVIARDDQLACVSWRPEEKVLKTYYFLPRVAYVSTVKDGQPQRDEKLSERQVDQQNGDIIVWMGKGSLYDICRAKPYEAGDLTNLEPDSPEIPKQFIETIKPLLPSHSHLLSLI